jgi:CRP-like cAMP-binding protein
MRLDKIRQHAFFSGMSEADLKLLEPYFALQTWVAGTTIFEQGDYAEYLYLMISGEVAIHYKPDDGPIMTVTHVQPGGLFGWSAAMGNPTYTSGASCALDSELARVRGEDLRSLYEKHPELKNVILSRLTAVIAERRKVRQGELTSVLANGFQQQASGRGGSMADSKVDPKLEIQMKALVEQLSAYTETFHGGTVDYVSFDGKVLKVRLGGACLGCPLSPSTLHGWVEGTVRQFFPDIVQVESV